MSGLPQALRALVGAPWWVYLGVVSACLLAYICRLVCVYKLGSKALDKASAEAVSEIINAVTGYHAEPGSRRRAVVGGVEPKRGGEVPSRRRTTGPAG